MKKIIIFKIFSIVIIFNSCTGTDENLSRDDVNLLKNCIEYIEKKEMKDYKECYLVDPYFSAILITNYFDYSDESFEKLFENKSKDYYKKLQANINSKFLNKFDKELETFSKCNQSTNYVLRFSGISNEFIMAYVYVYSNEVTKENLIERNYEDKVQQINDYIFLLDENKNIKEVLTGGVIFN